MNTTEIFNHSYIRQNCLLAYTKYILKIKLRNAGETKEPKL